MLFGANNDQQVRDEGTDHETPVNHHIGKKDEPAVSCATFQLASCFGACNRSSRVFPTNSDADQKTVSCQSCEHAIESPTSIRASTEGCEDDQDDSREEERIRPRPFITSVPEYKLAEDCACEGNRRDVLLRRGSGVFFAVQSCQDG
jgi:hypothetical protein